MKTFLIVVWGIVTMVTQTPQTISSPPVQAKTYYQIALGENLVMQIAVFNAENHPVDCTVRVHKYYWVGLIDDRVSGTIQPGKTRTFNLEYFGKKKGNYEMEIIVSCEPVPDFDWRTR